MRLSRTLHHGRVRHGTAGREEEWEGVTPSRSGVDGRHAESRAWPRRRGRLLPCLSSPTGARIMQIARGQRLPIARRDNLHVEELP